MKKIRRIRNSVTVIAVFSLMAGGLFHVAKTDESSQVKKAVQCDIASVSLNDKGVRVLEDSSKESNVEEVTQAKVESDQVVAKVDTFLNVRSDASEDSTVVGRFYNGNVGTLIEQDGDWALVSSGNVYGYVKNDYVLSGVDAEEYIENNCDYVAKVTATALNVRESSSTDGEIVALSAQGDALSAVDVEDDWVKVTMGADVTGYVSSDYVCLDYAYETAKTIEEDGQAEAVVASAPQATEPTGTSTEEIIYGTGDVNNTEPQDGTTAGNTNTEPQDGTTAGDTNTEPMITDAPAITETADPTTISTRGQEIADFAIQFVGNPYKYGGTSLTDGADCSGFVYAVYAHFGYQLPRSSYDQANAGYQVSVSDLKPGDLIFYRDFGHVALYVGNGQVVHASTPQTGIKYSAYNYASICRVVRIVD